MHWSTITIFYWPCARNMIRMPAEVRASTMQRILPLIGASNSRHDRRSFDAKILYPLSEAFEKSTKTNRLYRGHRQTHEISSRSQTQLRAGRRQAGYFSIRVDYETRILLRSTEGDRRYDAVAVGNHDLVYESYFRS